MADNPLQTFRDTLNAISPRWLKRGVAQRILYAFGVHFDLVGDAAAAGVQRRWPGLNGQYDSLALVGNDRRIRRGAVESDADYAGRLVEWLDQHRIRGGPDALLAQIQAYYSTGADIWDDGLDDEWGDGLGGIWSTGGGGFRIDLIYRSGVSFTKANDGSVTKGFYAGFSPDGHPEAWARWWAFYSWTEEIDSDGTWASGGTWDDGGVWDYDLTTAQVADFRLVPAEWNAAHALGTLVIMSPGIELWGVPDGLWGDPGNWGDGPGTIATLTVQPNQAFFG